MENHSSDGEISEDSQELLDFDDVKIQGAVTHRFGAPHESVTNSLLNQLKTTMTLDEFERFVCDSVPLFATTNMIDSKCHFLMEM